MAELRQYVTGQDGGMQNRGASTILLHVEHSNLTRSAFPEIRLDLHMTVGALKEKLYTHTGTQPVNQRLQLRDSAGAVKGAMDGDDRKLGYFSPEEGDIIYIQDMDPFSASAKVCVAGASMSPSHPIHVASLSHPRSAPLGAGGSPPGGVLREPDVFFVKDRPKGPPTANHQAPPTAKRRQPPTANRQPPAATNRQPPTANHCQPPSTTNHQPPTATKRHSRVVFVLHSSVTGRYLWSSRPLTSHFFRLLCARALDQASCGSGLDPPTPPGPPHPL